MLCLHDVGFTLQICPYTDLDKYGELWNPIVISGMRHLSLKISQPCHLEDCLATGEIFDNCTVALFVFWQHVAAVWAGWILFKTNQGTQTCFVSNLLLLNFSGVYHFHWGSFSLALHITHITTFHACKLQGRQVSKETDPMSWLIWTTYKLIINRRPRGILCFQFQCSIAAWEHVASPPRVCIEWSIPRETSTDWH